MDHAIGYVKDYLAEEVGRDNITAYFAQIGIEKVSSTYKLPLERSHRLVALNTALKGIQSRGYARGTYAWRTGNPSHRILGKSNPDIPERQGQFRAGKRQEPEQGTDQQEVKCAGAD